MTTKRALVVGINDYATNWSNTTPHWFRSLNCCVADANEFSNTLVNGFGFDSSNVTVLLDSQATHDNIINTLQGLLNQSEAGDVVCFYYSGHGDRFPEDGWEGSSGRYYETIVPWDANMITSKDIAAMADGLQPSYVNFTIILDSCHSGGIYLSSEDQAAAPAGKGYCAQDDSTITAFVERVLCVLPWICSSPDSVNGNVSQVCKNSDGSIGMYIDPSKDNPEDAKATLFSACNYNETAGESTDIGHGYFTKAIIDAVNACGYTVTYTNFLDAIRTAVANYSNTQNPQLRGRPVRLEENFLDGWNYSVASADTGAQPAVAVG
jgi:Caspase domain